MFYSNLIIFDLFLLCRSCKQENQDDRRCVGYSFIGVNVGYYNANVFKFNIMYLYVLLFYMNKVYDETAKSKV